MSAKITRWVARDKLSAAHLNEIWDLEAKRAAMVDNLISEGSRVGGDINAHVGIIIAKIVTAGPSGEADYTDERHWAIEVIIDNDGTITEYDQIETTDADPWQAPNGTMVPVILTITNLSDLANNSHSLTAGQYVLVFAIIDSTPVDGDGNVTGAPNFRYVTPGATGGVGLLQDGTNVISNTPFINFPSTFGTSNILQFVTATISGTPGANLILHGGATRQVLQYNGSVYLWDYVRFH